MPTYLCHGFKWERQALRGWIIIHDVEDAQPDWIIAPASKDGILATFAREHPFVPFGPAWTREEEAPEDEDEAEGWYEPVHLLEEYSATVETREPARPFAYVADHVVRVDHGVDIGEEMRKYEALEKKVGEKDGEEGWWFERLRLGLRVFREDTMDIGWHVVVCDDEERAYEDDEESEEGEEEETTIKDEVKDAGGKEEKIDEKIKEDGKGAGESSKEERKKSLKSGLRGLLPIRKKPKA
ncbi:hypothetical protein LIA77_07064 [Sarocladium implicatum]|nr:hypothetical protein LIA77_07064 [Sarocladium implicatum]